MLLLRSASAMEGSVKVCPVFDVFVDTLNIMLRRHYAAELQHGALVRSFENLKLSGHMVHSKNDRMTRRNSYTVEFNEQLSKQSLRLAML